MSRGRFITLEGGEGTGKSTLIAGLMEALSAKGIDLLITREPGGTPLAEAVREIVLHPPGDKDWSPLAQALLMNAARADHLEKKIRPALETGTWVLCDRFSDSTLAYQSVGGASLQALKRFEEEVVGQDRPDLTLILDADPQQLLTRRSGRGAADVFERQDIGFHEQIRAVFLQIAKDAPERCVLLDAAQDQNAVLKQALATIENRLSLP